MTFQGWTVKSLAPAEARAFVETHHYLHTAPTNTSFAYGLTDEHGELHGVAMYGPTSYKNGASAYADTDTHRLLELRRFVLDANEPNQASWFLSRTLKSLPHEVGVVVSHADCGQGHVGFVYQACNFLYRGTTARDYHYVDSAGRLVHKRIPWQRAKTGGRYVDGCVDESTVAAEMGLMKVLDPPKHTYFRLLRRGLKAKWSLPYPKTAGTYGSIYVLLDPVTSEVRYVGQTVNPVGYRLRQHMTSEGTTHVKYWIRSLMQAGMDPIILPVASVPVEYLDQEEKRWIAEFRRRGASLTNLTEGGRTLGFGEDHPASRLTEIEVREIREKSAAGATYHQLALEYDFVGISDVVRGRSWAHSDGPIQRGRKAFTLKGTTHTAESRQNMAAAQRALSQFTAEDVAAIREAFAAGTSLTALADQYGASKSGTYQVTNGSTWKDLPLPARSTQTVEQVKEARLAASRAKRSTLTDERVLHLRNRYATEGISIKDLAQEESMDRSTLGALLRGQSWTHLPVLGSANPRARNGR